MTRTFLSIYFLPKISYLIWHTSTYGVSQHYPCYVTRLAMLIWRGQYGTATYHPRYRALTVSPDSGSVFFHLTHSQEWHVIEIKRERGKRRYCTLQKWLPLLFFFFFFVFVFEEGGWSWIPDHLLKAIAVVTRVSLQSGEQPGFCLWVWWKLWREVRTEVLVGGGCQ